MKLITIKVTIPGDQKEVPNPPQKLDSGEFIVKRVVEIEKMVDILTGAHLRSNSMFVDLNHCFRVLQTGEHHHMTEDF
jgi:hypothetical protein